MSNQSGINNAPQFNALNGEELIEVILTDIRESLLRTGDFKLHQTFPLVKYSFSVAVNVYPTQSLNDPPKTQAVGVVVKGDPSTAKPDSPPKIAEAKATKTIDTPDAARKASGIPLKVPAKVAGAVIDKEIITPVAKAPAGAVLTHE